MTHACTNLYFAVLNHPCLLIFLLTIFPFSDLTNGQVRVTCAHDDAVTHVEWLPTGEPFVISSSVDKTLKMWDVRNAQCMQTWKGHSDAALTFAVTEDGGTIISGSDDHTCLVFKR